MTWWGWTLEIIGLFLLALVLVGLCLVVRRRMLASGGSAFELSYRARSDQTGRGWLLGLGRYAGEDLEWFRIFSLSPRPKRTWSRIDVEYAGRRSPVGNEQLSLYSDHVVVECETPSGLLELAMDEDSLKGFQSWLEAMPPGTRSVRPGEPTSGL